MEIISEESDLKTSLSESRLCYSVQGDIGVETDNAFVCQVNEHLPSETDVQSSVGQDLANGLHAVSPVEEVLSHSSESSHEVSWTVYIAIAIPRGNFPKCLSDK